MNLEVCWYEFSPYIYAVLGILAIVFSDSFVGVTSGGLLIVAAITIVRLRWHYRKTQDAKVKRAIRR
jgi:hypothetical protein